jgi:DNA-binding response OmpR family regulator
MKVLVIEDEKELSDSICSYLANEQFVCERTFDFDHPWRKFLQYDYACIVLDVNLPGGSGLDILKELKNQNKTDGVLIISQEIRWMTKSFALKDRRG